MFEYGGDKNLGHRFARIFTDLWGSGNLHQRWSGRDALTKSGGSLLSPNASAQHDSAKNKSSEVVWGPFVSASSSRLTLARPAFTASLAGRCARSSLGLRAHRQPDKPTLRLGTLSCLQHFFSVRLDQRFAIDPCSPSFPTLRSGK